jgi:cobalamin biosynthesis Mg chelatase CobN
MKDEAKRLVTGPVAIPDCPDCDYPRGEKLLSVDEIEGMVHEYNTRSQMADAMHVYGATKQTIGVAVENWTLKEPLTTKNIQGREVQLPRGTWMTTIKVTDDTTWERIQDGTYQGFSASYMSREDADQVLAGKRVLIADLEDPIPVTISIVDQPCVFDATFCSIKQDESEADKAGRKISNATLKKIQDAFDNMKTLINDALTERGVETESNKTDKNELEDLKMDNEVKKEIQSMIQESIKTALESREEPEPEEKVGEEVKEEVPEAEPEPTEAEKQLAEANKEIEALKKKLGEGESQKIEGQDDEPAPEPVQKFRVEEGRDIYGRKIRA